MHDSSRSRCVRVAVKSRLRRGRVADAKKFSSSIWFKYSRLNCATTSNYTPKIISRGKIQGISNNELVGFLAIAARSRCDRGAIAGVIAAIAAWSRRSRNVTPSTESVHGTSPDQLTKSTQCTRPLPVVLYFSIIHCELRGRQVIMATIIMSYC